MTSELTREDEADSGLDLAGREGGLLVVTNKLAGLGGDALEDVVDEGVHDGHGALGDARVGVDLLENLEDVRGIRLGALLTLAALLGGLLGALAGRGLGGGLGSNALAGSGGHVVLDVFDEKGFTRLFTLSIVMSPHLYTLFQFSIVWTLASGKKHRAFCIFFIKFTNR